MGAVSIVIPAYNESGIVGKTVVSLKEAFKASKHAFEIIVVNDGSTDNTGAEAENAGALVIRHPQNMGYGNAILTGVHHAKHPLIAITDADGTYPLSELPAMLQETEERNLDMLVGARKGTHYDGTAFKRGARAVLKLMAEFTAGERIPDVNSGLRVIRRDMILEYAPLLCGGFSFTTTITVIAMLNRRSVGYRSIEYNARHGKSKVSYLRDALRVIGLLVRVLLVFRPMKLVLLLMAGTLGMGIAVLPTYVVFGASGWKLVILSVLGPVLVTVAARKLLAEKMREKAQMEGAGSFKAKK